MWSRLLLPESTTVRLAGLAILDLVWRVPAAVPVEDGVSDLVLASLSVAAGVTGGPVVEQATTWLLLGYAALSFAPTAYPRAVDFPVTDWAFRLLFTVTALGSGVLLLAFVFDQGGDSGWTPLVSLGAITLWMGVAVGTFLFYLDCWAGWQLTPADDRFVQSIGLYVPAGESVPRSVHRAWSVPGWCGRLNRGLAVVLVGVTVAIPGMLAGFVVSLLVLSYPLADMLILGTTVWVAGARVVDRLPRPASGLLDLESRLYDALSYSVRSLKGLTLVTYLIGILVPFPVMVGEALALAPSVLGTATTFIIEDPLVLTAPPVILIRELTGSVQVLGPDELFSVLVGYLLLMSGGVAYGTWCFLRELPRIEAFLRWEEHTNTAVAPARPVGFVFPAVGIVAPLLTWELPSLLSRSTLPSSALQAVTLFAAGWPLAALALVGCWALSRRRDRMAVHREDHLIIWTTGVLVVVYGVLTVTPRITAWLDLSLLLIMWGYWDDVTGVAAGYTASHGYVTGGYLCLVGVSTGALSVLVSGVLPLVIPGAVLVGGVLTIALTAVDTP